MFIALRIRRLLALSAVAVSLGCGTWQAARFYQSGSAALDAGDVEQAVEDLERAAALEPGRSEIHNHLGLALAAAGRSQAARTHLQRAVDLDCTNQAAAQNLAILEARAIVARAGDESGDETMTEGMAP